MTADALSVLRFLFGTIWRIFNSWYIPGTATTPAAFLLFCMFAGLSLRFLRAFFSLPQDNAPVHRDRPNVSNAPRLNAPKKR